MSPPSQTSLPPPSAPYPSACHRAPVCVPWVNSHWLSILHMETTQKLCEFVLSKEKEGNPLKKISFLYECLYIFYKSLSDLLFNNLKIISSCNSNPGHIPEKMLLQKDTCNMDISFFFNGWIISHCVYKPHLLYQFICHWTLRLLPCIFLK